MKTLKEIEKKYQELNDRMAKIPMWDFWNRASTDGQRYILEWVMDEHD